MASNFLNKVFISLFFLIGIIWLLVPFIMALLWSLVDPSEPWTVEKT